MRINRLGYDFEIPNEWVKEVGFQPLKTKGEHYCPLMDKQFFVVEISDICPKIRTEGVPIFKDGCVNEVWRSAKERTVSILKAITTGIPIPPVDVVKYKVRSKYKYKLVHGAHRLHCSIAAGFDSIPVVCGFDINDC